MQLKGKTSSDLEKNKEICEADVPKNKLKYVTPAIQVDIIEMENGIAAASGAQIRIGGESNTLTPDVEDWQVTENEQQLFL